MGTGINGALIDLRDVVKTYKTGAGSLTVLKEVTLKVYPGEFISIVGPSGSGKSTLLNMITGIDKPTKGQVFVGGEAVHLLSENKLAHWRGRHVGVVFQFFQLLPTLTALENVMLPMDFCHLYHGREREQRALSLLDQVGIAAQAHKLPSALSGGEQQRAAIARALANDPPLIVADEPTGNLDTATATEVFALGFVYGTSGVLRARLTESYQASVPAHLTFYTSVFQPELVDTLRHEPGVADAEGMFVASIRWKLEGEKNWRNGTLVARPDFTAQRVNRFELLQGVWPDQSSNKHALAVERLSANYWKIPVGGKIIVESGRDERELSIEGIARHPQARLSFLPGPRRPPIWSITRMA